MTCHRIGYSRKCNKPPHQIVQLAVRSDTGCQDVGTLPLKIWGSGMVRCIVGGGPKLEGSRGLLVGIISNLVICDTRKSSLFLKYQKVKTNI
jgi:hypothetical protein